MCSYFCVLFQSFLSEAVVPQNQNIMPVTKANCPNLQAEVHTTSSSQVIAVQVKKPLGLVLSGQHHLLQPTPFEVVYPTFAIKHRAAYM